MNPRVHPGMFAGGTSSEGRKDHRQLESCADSRLGEGGASESESKVQLKQRKTHAKTAQVKEDSAKEKKNMKTR